MLEGWLVEEQGGVVDVREVDGDQLGEESGRNA